MKGQEIFDKYQDEADLAGPGTNESYYAGVLFTSIVAFGEDKVFPLLEKAEKEGKKITFSYPIDIKIGPSEPNGIILI